MKASTTELPESLESAIQLGSRRVVFFASRNLNAGLLGLVSSLFASQSSPSAT